MPKKTKDYTVLNFHLSLKMKLDYEIRELVKQKGDKTCGAVLHIRLSKLNKLKTENRLIFEEESDDKVFELLLALMGYDKTSFTILPDGISESEFEFLYSIRDKDKLFYRLLYTYPEEPTADKDYTTLLDLIKNNLDIEDEKLIRIYDIAKRFNRNIREIMGNYRKNQAIIEEKIPEWKSLIETSSKYKKLCALIYTIGLDARRLFIWVIDNIDKIDKGNLSIFIRANNEFYKGAMSSAGFEKVCYSLLGSKEDAVRVYKSIRKNTVA